MATTGGTYNRGTQSSLNRGGGHTRRDNNPRNSGRETGQEMSESQVVGFLGRKILQAMNDEDGDLSQVRQENFNYYIGDAYGDEREGYSKFVTRESLEVIEWVLPSVLRVFLSGDQVVSFEPTDPMDEQSAKQETEITNHFVMKSNNNGEGGFLSLHHWMKDCLMYPNGYIKVYMDEYTKTDVGTVSGLSEIGVQMLVSDPDVEILEQRTRQEMMQGPQGAQPIEVFDLKVRTTKQVTELRVEPVPPEECLVDNDCHSLNLDEADFVCHRVRKTYTQLVNEGYDPDELDSVGMGEDYQWNDERTNRLFYEDEDPDTEDEDDASMRKFWVHECHAWFDYNGDGLGEFRRVVLIGDKVFDNEETNYQPMVAMSAILMQHKHTGMGYIDIMKDLQILISILTRQMLDNIYRINVRKKFFSEDALTEDGSTMEAMLNTQAEYVPVRGPAANAVMPDQTQSIAGEILPVIQHFSERVAVRSGVTPESGVAANDLQEVRQEVFSNALDRASQRIEMLVRIFAETGYRQLMLKAHQLLRSHWDIPKAVRIRGQWVDVDPQGWRDRTDMNVEVGLGFHTKQQVMGMLVQLLGMQKEAGGQGMADPSKIYHTLDKLVNAAGLGDVRSFFIDPNSPEFQPPEPPPDPNMILAQAQAQALQSDQENKRMEIQVKAQTDGAKAQAEAAKASADAQNAQADREIKLRELALKEIELQKTGMLEAGELEAKVANIRADTRLKEANADKAMAEAAATAIEAGETYQQALKVVAEGAELNDGGELTADGIEREGEDNAEAGDEETGEKGGEENSE